MVKNRPVQGADRTQLLAIAKTRRLEVGDFAPQDVVLRIDQRFLKSPLSTGSLSGQVDSLSAGYIDPHWSG